MAYANEGIDQRAEVIVGSAAQALVYYAKHEGAPVTVDPATGFVTLLDPAGATLVARAACTIAALGKLSVSQAYPEATYPLAEDYIALWEWQVGSVAYADRQYFDVVRNKLICPIDTSDVQEVYPDITSHLASVGETDCNRAIRRAWAKLCNRIRAGKNRPALILDRARLVNCALELACAFTARMLSKETDDLWHGRMVEHFKEYHAEFAGLGDLKYDKDEDAVASNDEKTRINRKLFSV